MTAIAFWPRAPEKVERQELALITSLPIYWGEQAELSDLLGEDAALPWVRQVVEQNYTLRPLDRIAKDEPGAAAPLQDIERLLIIQPRGLAADENVALDDWVREGGRLLYVIDPLLTGHYAYPIGDPRFPPMVGLVPPVLPRWGVTVAERDGESAEPYLLETPVGPIPVMRAGQLRPSNDPMDGCTISPGAILADCEVGQGRVTVVADAALFELEQGSSEQQERILALLDYAFS